MYGISVIQSFDSKLSSCEIVIIPSIPFSSDNMLTIEVIIKIGDKRDEIARLRNEKLN